MEVAFALAEPNVVGVKGKVPVMVLQPNVPPVQVRALLALLQLVNPLAKSSEVEAVPVAVTFAAVKVPENSPLPCTAKSAPGLVVAMPKFELEISRLLTKLPLGRVVA